MKNEFMLCQGVSVEKLPKLCSCWQKEDNGCHGLLSVQDIALAAVEFIENVRQPLFFFLEIPSQDDLLGKYEQYYLDNCTKEVCRAIMQRYGELLVQDGISRFGFGSHKTQEEIYFTEYQEFMLYAQSDCVNRIMAKVGAKRMEKAASIWDILSEDNQGSLSVVEIDGETVFDIPINLKNAGMYKADS